MKTRWMNPYINKLLEKPDYIVAGTDDELSSEQIKFIHSKASKFTKVICEICCGSGGHLIDCAKESPDTLFVAFELRFKRAFNIAKKAEKQQLNNVLVIRTDANLLTTVFTNDSLQGVFINFPDPWDAEKWKKNRILKPEYLNALTQSIKNHGFFSYKSDHREYFESTCKIIEEHRNFQVMQKSLDLYKDMPLPKTCITEFEKMFYYKGIPICYLLTKIIKD